MAVSGLSAKSQDSVNTQLFTVYGLSSYKAISDLENNEEHILFQTGNRQLSRKLRVKVCSSELATSAFGINVPCKLVKFPRNSALHEDFKHCLRKNRSILAP